MIVSSWIEGARSRLSHNGLVRDIGVTYAGTVIGSGIGFVIQLYLQKHLGPEDYGILGLATAVGTLAGVFTDLGLSDAMIRFAGKYREDQPDTAISRCAAALLARLALIVVVGVVGFLAADYIATNLYEKPELRTPLAWVFIGMAGGSLYGYWTYFIQAYERFFTRSAVNVTIATARLIAVLILGSSAALSPTSMIIVDAAVNFTGFLLGLAFSPRGLTRALHPKRREEIRQGLRELVPYCKYTGLLIVGDTIFNETDTLMLGYFVTAEEVGTYRVAWTYVMVITFLNIAAGSVLFPKLSRLSQPGDVGRFLGECTPMLLGMCLLTVPYAAFVYFWLPWFDNRYAAALPLFYVLYVGLVFDLVAGSLSLALFSLDRPGILAGVSVLKIVVNILANLVLISLYGVLGAAIATLITRVLGGVIYLVALRRALQRPVSGSGQ